jgi:putative ABC transport system ATP-binding protein
VSVLVVDEVEKWWDASSGLRPVTFAVDGGEFVVVRGRSGSGKSTLLALIIGWCQPDGGSVTVAGTDSAAPSPSWSSVAIVPQVLGLVPELTVRENVAEAARGPAPSGARTDESRADESRVDEILVALDLVDMADRSPADTSMGQQQRVAIARALAGRPLLLLADEPTSHQDAGHVAAVVTALRSAAEAGSAVLVATHDDSIIAAASRVIDLGAPPGH